MNIQAPISSIMSTDLMVVQSEDKVVIVKDIMEVNGIHHVPVVNFNKLVGMISKSDLLHFLKGMNYNSYQDLMNDVRLKNYTAGEIMTGDLECLEPKDTIEKAIILFQKNRFHSIPIIEKDNSLVGILTTFDIINMIVEKVDA
ncbi:MAG: HPP family protein [Saprospiraceae bacterium]